jgi:hypothetical protein
MQKRTKALDDDKEVLLFTQADGSPVWTTTGQIRQSRADLEERSAKLKAAVKMGNIQQVVAAVRRLVNAWLESVIEELAPVSIIEAGEKAVGDWIMAEGLSFHRDGLTWLVKRQGSVVVELPVDVSESVRADVLLMLAMEEGG